MRRTLRKFPEMQLFGTPVQIHFARQLMGQLACQRAQATSACESLAAVRCGSDAHALAKWYITHVFHHQKRATWWIANREYLLCPWFIEEYLRAYRPGRHAVADEPACVAAVWEEAMLRPAKARFRGAVEVHALPNAGKEETGQILVRYEMNPELSRVARGAKLRWDHARTAYVRTVDECAMPLVDRAAEVCAKLLTAGFRVLALDASVREKALSGTYAREYPRWIRRGKNPFTLEFLYAHNPWLHERVRSLGARWSGQAMEVNWMLTEETQEFAQLYNFRITEDAQEIFERWHRTVKNARIWEETGAEEALLPALDGDALAERLCARIEIPEDLRDDDG